MSDVGKNMRTGAVLVAVLAVCTCSSSVPPPPGDPVPFKLVNTSGLPSGGMDVIADSSIQGLNGLLLGVSSRNQSLCQYAAAWCWSPADFPPASAAFGVEVYQGCSASDLIGVYLSGTSLGFNVKVAQRQCAAGAGALAEPSFQLVAISLSDLPASLLRVHVFYGGVESPKSALLDLRQPLANPPSVSTRESEVQESISAANTVAGAPATGYHQVIGLAARRFAAGPVACVPPAATDAQPGYVIKLDGVDGEFDYAGGRAIHCPASSP